MTEGRELNCDEVRELLSPYQDRELTPDEMTAIAEHLESCPDCMHKSTILGQLSKVIKHWEGIKASELARQKLLEQVRRVSVRASAAKSVPLALLALLAGALLVGGGAALVVWLLQGCRERVGDEVVEAPPAAVLVHKVNKVEVVIAGAPVLVAGRRDLMAGQELRCALGAAAQLESPPGETPRWRAVLHGPAEYLVGDGLVSGKLVVHLDAATGGGSAFKLKAGRWSLVLPATRPASVGLIELRTDGSVRAAMLQGGARLGDKGPEIHEGQEVTMEPGGRLLPPKPVTDPEAFDLLTGAGQERPVGEPPAGDAEY
jgi:anti-sigma factor (TIGR02949 family)